MRKFQVLALAISTLALVVPVAVQEKGGQDETGPYDPVEGWFKPIHEGYTLFIDDVLAETPNRIIVVSYGEIPTPPPAGRGGRGGRGGGAAPSADASAAVKPDHFVVILDGNGNKIDEWTHAVPLMVHPHAAKISPYDPDKHVWIIDREGHQILKFTNDGKRVVLTLGEKSVAGADERHFNRPADIAFLPDGSMLVADGYAGTRVVKFDDRGQYLTAWGSPGKGPGQFSLVHCVVADAKGRVYVADRNNGRVQIFDAAGRYLDQWPIRRPNHLVVTQDQFLWLSDGANNRFLKYDLNGRLLTYWGVTGSFPGAMNNPHKWSVDSDGNLYVADYANNRVQKFKPKAGADRSRLIGQPYKAPGATTNRK